MKPVATTKGILPDEMLRDSEARYRWLFESTAIDGIMILDAETGQVVDVNPFLIKLLGFSREQLIKKKIWELGYFKDILPSKKNFKELLQKGFVRYDCLPLETAGGLKIDIEFVGHVYEAGNQKMIQCSIRDITERKRREEALRETNAYLEKLFDNTGVPIIVWDSQFKITRFNHAFESLTGRTASEVLRQTLDSLFPPSRSRLTMEIFRKTMTGEHLQAVEVEILPNNGAARTLLWNSATIFDSDGKTPTAVIAQGMDITERKQAEQEIASLAKFPSENPNPVLRLSRDGMVLYANAASGALLGMWGCAVGGTAPEFWRDLAAQALANSENKTKDIECDGKVYSMFVAPVAEAGYVNLYARDVTEHRGAEEALRASLREKEILLREVHHRVKNNMQVISSIFNLESGHTTNEECRAILKEGQTRIRSMSLVHENLYLSRNLSKIDLAAYIRSLADHLFHVYLINPAQVRMDTEFEEVALDINSAIPCGLILNELISNALKHAFPEGRTGMIKIGLRRGGGDAIELRVADDGVGLPEGLDFRKAESFGLQIVNLLVGQLDAAIDLDRTKGTAFTMTFRELKYALRI